MPRQNRTLGDEFDIAIFCALYEEAEAVRNVFHEDGWIAEKKKDELIKRDYWLLVKEIAPGRALRAYVNWLPQIGPIDMAMEGQKVLSQHKTFKMLYMAGICAGDKSKVALGDLIIAKGAYNFDAGKARLVDGAYELQADLDHKSLPSRVLQPLQGYGGWKKLVSAERRPLSLHHQRDSLIRKLLEVQRFTAIPSEWLRTEAPSWRQLVDKLKHCEPPLLAPDDTLAKPKEVSERLREDYSYEDKPECELHICEVASTAAVREDRPFQTVLHPVRRTFAIDMEGHSFYKLAEDHEKPALFVKGVCDFADQDKDDSYHAYAGRVSALVILSHIKELMLPSLPQPRRPSRRPNDRRSHSATRGLLRADNSAGAANDVSFWHSVRGRVADEKDVGTLIKQAEHHVVITGISLAYVIKYCKHQLCDALDKGVDICILLPSDSEDAYHYYERYTTYASEDITHSLGMYKRLYSELSAEHKRHFALACTSIPLTHSIGLYDGALYLSEFLVDRSSSECPSFSPSSQSYSYCMLITELSTLIRESVPVCGDLLIITNKLQKLILSA